MSRTLGRFPILFALIFWTLAGSAVAEDAKRREPSASEAQAASERADRELNEAWNAAKKALTPTEFASLREEQRSWTEYRDNTALPPGAAATPAKEKAARASADYFSSAAELTVSRTRWLKALIREDAGDSLTGEWSDGYGGQILIFEKDGKLYFDFDVVRGPTSHVGGIAGIASWNSPLGWFSDKGREKDRADETNLAFVQRNRKLEIVGANTQPYHGARAYFDGNYVKLGPLTAKQQKEVVATAKSGQKGE